jgi:ABC-type branched-subunit amino acid transport system substrate-binding protein
MTSSPRPRLLLALMALSALATACGSTVTTRTTFTGGPDDPSAALASTSPLVGASGASSELGQAPVSSGAGDGAPAPTGGLPSGAPPSGALPSEAPRSASGPPLSQVRPLRLGIVVTENNAALASTFGVKGVDNGDEPANAKAIVAQVNREGGVHGAPVQAVYYTAKISDASRPSDQLYTEICDYFTQDHATRVVLANGVFTDQLWACLKNRGAVGISGNPAYIGDRTTLGYPVLAPNGLGLERQLTAQVDALARGGYFTGSNKYALLSYDDVAFRGAVARSLKPALKARGITLTTEYYLPPINGAQDEGAHSSAAGSAVLRFRGDQVNRVIIAEGSAAGALFFMQQADAQGYRPRYGMTSAQFLNTLVSNVPASQLEGATALGWWPSGDLPTASHVNTPGRARCARALAAAHISYGVNSSQEQSAFDQCDMVFAAVDAARYAPGTSPTDVLNGAGALGSRWRSAAAVSSAFTTARHDAVNGYRVARFASACGCFNYTTPTVPIP